MGIIPQLSLPIEVILPCCNCTALAKDNAGSDTVGLPLDYHALDSA